MGYMTLNTRATSSLRSVEIRRYVMNFRLTVRKKTIRYDAIRLLSRKTEIKYCVNK